MDHNSQNNTQAVDPAVAPLLVGKRIAARLTGISSRSLDRLVSSGKFLLPVRLGGRVLWNRLALEQWVAAGCPVNQQNRRG